jgi:hypothetical protein
VAQVLDPAVHEPLDVLPDSVSIWPDNHHALHRSVVGQLRFKDELDIPLREIFAFRRDSFDLPFVIAHFIFFASKTLLILSAKGRIVKERSPKIADRT